jgi:hypothetical protein
VEQLDSNPMLEQGFPLHVLFVAHRITTESVCRATES